MPIPQPRAKCPTCGTVKCKYVHRTITKMAVMGDRVLVDTADGKQTAIILPSQKLLHLAQQTEW